MPQHPQRVRLLLKIALLLAIATAIGFFIRKKFTRPVSIIPQPPPATSPSTQPTAQPIIALQSPPRTYMELINRQFPRLATTQPIEQTLNMRDWGHFHIPHPLHIDRRGVLWITRPDAEETETLLPTAPTRQVQLTRERVLFAHWFFSEGGDWLVMLVTPSAKGGFDLVSAKDRRPIGDGGEYDWSRAFSIPSERKMVVPRSGKISIFTTADNISETVSPPLADGGTVQIQMDQRGFLAWVPPDASQPASKGVVRYVDGKWLTLGPEQGWPSNLLHLIPLDDGTVLQIIAENDGKVRLAYAALDAKDIDEQRVSRLIIDLSDTDAQKREKAFAELTKFGPGLWPIAEKMMDSALPEAQERLKSLLKSKLTPLLGGMQLADAKLRVASRFPDGGVLFFAENGVLLPRGDLEPFVVHPAWIVARPGMAVQLLDQEMTQSMDAARSQIAAVGTEWIITDPVLGPQRLFGGLLVPLLRKNEMQFSELVGIDARGRFIFREPSKNDRPILTTQPATTQPTSRPALPALVHLSDSPSLIIDPTLPDPIPRLPVWHIIVKQGSVGWTADDWPVMKAGGAWALATKDWRSLDEKTEKVLSRPEDVPPPPQYVPDIPTTLPSTAPTSNPTTHPAPNTLIAPNEKPLLHDPDGNWYFDGKTSLKVISKTGHITIWPLPGPAAGDAEPWIIRTPDGLLFLFNQPGRLLRIRPTPDAHQPFDLEATFSRKIPNDPPTRIWLDPAGRIIIAFAGNQLAILFPHGFIPPATDRIIPAGEQGMAGDD
ncbi:MAG TPA: hypothetical protein VGQ99_06150 [Tepidisphaeraceae bacterium]|jgi:hypothetical protein|nr:hypothetical protein [Tepidisphaeraceae bacterium]